VFLIECACARTRARKVLVIHGVGEGLDFGIYLVSSSNGLGTRLVIDRPVDQRHCAAPTEAQLIFQSGGSLCTFGEKLAPAPIALTLCTHVHKYSGGKTQYDLTSYLASCPSSGGLCQ